ncbi:dTDP-3-amino-3,4,6-trideoxy-alpha-D-glucopyranose [Pseudovibrio axinellae]|uniref:dTDP-3-amino-3,4, 6-trideoxy-alpha-D-glucopyranose n=1 Tax=Pseudovibrio axinellae TaxID=989403 RepID=A0A161VAH5_9HYPH|nr:class I SAM-dependent methyltransferase [Pseudovibrio axinellae]KZL21009.1 dTDP-3-amino-3,4,6-trideoxy-alpha-D-glucopyranose [Pseudovibrio axinellae]SEP79172.1 Methyltransferase domain-containing protein [Pseudovibrio axinellae]
MQETSEDWDHQCGEGRWHFLNDVKEAARYGILTAWLTHTAALRSVLDVGCGEAILYHHLKARGLGKYCGVDLSEAALSQTALKQTKAQLQQCDLESFLPQVGANYSAIVFNEVLYFCEEPEGQLNRYAEFLEDNGVIVISMYSPARKGSGANRTIKRIWEETDIKERWQVLDDLELTSFSKNIGWKLRLVTPARRKG